MFAVLRRPSLWWVALRQAVALVPPGWFRRAPFLPVPSREYLRFRMVTAHGGSGAVALDPHEVVTYLEWCAAWPAVARRR